MAGVDEIPTLLAAAWNIPIYAAQGILTAVIIMLLVLPIVILGDGNKGESYLEITLSFIGVFIASTLGWLDPGVFIVMCMGLFGITLLVVAKPLE